MLAAQGMRVAYQRAVRFLPWNAARLVRNASVQPHWLGRGHHFWYRRQTASGYEFLLVDPDKGSVRPAFDAKLVSAELSRATGLAIQSEKLPFHSFAYLTHNQAIGFAALGKRWSCGLAAAAGGGAPACTQLHPPSRMAMAAYSPNGLFAAFVQHHNLYVKDVSTGLIERLTTDGRAERDYATPLPTLEMMVEQGTEDVHQPASVFWSPDSVHLVTYRIDSRRAGRFTSIQYAPPGQLRPRTFTCVYPLPGEPLATAQPLIFNVLTGRRTEVHTRPLDIKFQGGPYFKWLDAQHFYYLHYRRGYQHVEMRLVDARSGRQRVMLAENEKPYIDLNQTFYRLYNGGRRIVWSSDRSGWNQLYLFNNQGKLLRPITQGDWVVRRLIRVEPKRRLIYLLGAGRRAGQDPYQTHLYSVRLDGQELTDLTPKDANHDVSLSPDGQYFVDNASRPDLPGASTLRRAADGSTVRVLERPGTTALLRTGWRYPIRFRGMAADGKTPIYGLIWRPTNFKPVKKYPVVENVYTGPQGFFVPKTFRGGYQGWGNEQAIAELGFIVAMVDGRGTAGRSKAFHDFSYRNLGNVLVDHVALIRQMAKRYPWMDVSRVGIYGTSAGGYDAAHALLTFPNFYKVGISISGNQDQRLDKAWWNEQYQGYPVERNYAKQSNVTLAKRLKGHLLLIHGDVDPNVDTAETMRLVRALMRANKDFQMLLVPNMFHGEGKRTYLTRRNWDYLVRHLLHRRPPHNFSIPPPPPRRH